MRHTLKLSATRSLLHKATSIALPHSFPTWIDSSEHGVMPVTVIPRVRDNLVLRLVAGRRLRQRTLIHANGTP